MKIHVFKGSWGGRRLLCSLHYSHSTNNSKMLQTLTKSPEVTSPIRDTCMGLVDLGLVPFWRIRTPQAVSCRTRHYF